MKQGAGAGMPDMSGVADRDSAGASAGGPTNDAEKYKQVDVYQSDMPKYNKDSYSITGKKVCLVLVISKFDDKQYNRKNTENDHKLASEVLKSRGFEVILLVDYVTKKEFTKKLRNIRERTDIGLFMLVVSSHGDENDNVMFSDNSDWNNGRSRYVLQIRFRRTCDGLSASL